MKCKMCRRVQRNGFVVPPVSLVSLVSSLSSLGVFYFGFVPPAVVFLFLQGVVFSIFIKCPLVGSIHFSLIGSNMFGGKDLVYGTTIATTHSPIALIGGWSDWMSVARHYIHTYIVQHACVLFLDVCGRYVRRRDTLPYAHMTCYP